jgi:hypothetical protein
VIILGNRYCKEKFTNSGFGSQHGGIFLSRRCGVNPTDDAMCTRELLARDNADRTRKLNSYFH